MLWNPHIARGSSDKCGNPSTACSFLAFLAPFLTNSATSTNQWGVCLEYRWQYPILGTLGVCLSCHACLARYIDIASSIRTIRMSLVQLSRFASQHIAQILADARGSSFTPDPPDFTSGKMGRRRGRRPFSWRKPCCDMLASIGCCTIWAILSILR